MRTTLVVAAPARVSAIGIFMQPTVPAAVHIARGERRAVADVLNKGRLALFDSPIHCLDISHPGRSGGSYGALPRLVTYAVTPAHRGVQKAKRRNIPADH